MRLLVVEDDPDLNRQLTTALTDAGSSATTVGHPTPITIILIIIILIIVIVIVIVIIMIIMIIIIIVVACSLQCLYVACIISYCMFTVHYY